MIIAKTIYYCHSVHMIKSILKSHYHSAQFKPNPLSYFLNPFCIARNELYQNMRKAAESQRYKDVLDVGCGGKPYEHLFGKCRYIGLEYDTPHSRKHSKADCFYSGNAFPLDSEEFDLVVCNQVLEHVPDTASFLSEIHRVLKIDGTLILTVPFIWDEHEQPNDFYRFTSYGLKRELEVQGFHVTSFSKLNRGFSGLVQILTGQIYKLSGCRKISLIIIAPINMLGLMFSKVLPQNSDFYLDNFIVVKKS